MDRHKLSACALALCAALTGCHSPYRSDQGALFGGLTGAGVGALVGNAVGATGAGAAIGAGVAHFLAPPSAAASMKSKPAIAPKYKPALVGRSSAP